MGMAEKAPANAAHGVGDPLDVQDPNDERERLAHALGVERARLVEVFRQAPSFLAVLRGPQHVFEYANDAYLHLIGRREIVARRW